MSIINPKNIRLAVLVGMRAIVLFLPLSFFALTASAALLPSSWDGVKQEVLKQVDLAQKTFVNGDTVSAKEILSDAYFEKFEALGMEMVVKKYISSARAYELERIFGKIRKGMTANDIERVKQEILNLTERLEHDAAILDQKKIPLEGAGYISPSASGPIEKSDKDDLQTQQGPSGDKLLPEEIVNEIELVLQRASVLYNSGDSRGAKGLVSDAYFDLFEGKGLETMVAMQSGGLKLELESKFANILGLIEKGVQTEQLKSSMLALTNQLHTVAEKLNPSTNLFELFISSVFIIVREGFEAILIISALIAYLRKTGNKDKVKVVALGVLAAVGLSIVTALLFLKIYTRSGSSQENLEGITMLIAAAVLVYVSYWLTSKAEAAKWMAYIQNQVIRSIGKGSLFTLGFAAFIVVYREGAETILFYSALFSKAGGEGTLPIWGGFASGGVILLLIYYTFEYGTARIPIRPFFNATSAILYYMAFVFAGEGVVELQIGGLIRATPVNWMPRIGFLGINPTLESLALQGMILLAAFIALFYLFVIHPYRTRGKVLEDVAHTLGDLHNLHNKVEHIRTHATSGIKLASANTGQEIKKISEHLSEIDSSSHELLGHLEYLRNELSMVLGNIENGGGKVAPNKKNKKIIRNI